MDAELMALLDHHKIVRTSLNYAKAIDTRDRELFADCFTPDGIFSTPLGERVGRAEIAATSAISHLDACQHVTTNQTVDISGDTATMRSYFIASHLKYDHPGGANYIVGGQYDDELARCDDGVWRFTRRKITILWNLGNAAVMGEELRGKI